MSNHPGFEKYLRLVDQLHNNVRARLNGLRDMLVRHNKPEKLERAKAARVALGELANLFDQKDLPGWIQPLQQAIGVYVDSFQSDDDKAQSNNAAAVMEQIFGHFHSIYNESLTQDRLQAIQGVDFDAIFRSTYDASQLPTLFDELVSLLQQIIAADVIEHVRALRELETLIELLKKNRKGSYFSAWSTWQVVRAGALNVLAEYADDNTLVGPFIRGVKKTMADMEFEWSHVNAEVVSQIKASFRFELPGIAQSPAPMPPALPAPCSADVIDAEQTGEIAG